MSMIPDAFTTEQQGHTLIVTALIDLRELNYEEVEAGARHVLHLLHQKAIKNVVLDFHKTDYYGSTALGFFVKLWKRIKERNGHMAFCCVSAHEREILKVTNLAGLWPICASRAEALASVEE